MPLSFTITREDMLRSKVLEPGWYKMFIKNVTQEPAGTDGSTNTILDHVVVQDGPFKDVPVRRWFSEKAPGFAVPLLIACGAKVGESGGTFNMESCKGKTVMAYVENDMYQGRPTNKITDYRPVGGDTSTAPSAAPLPSPGDLEGVKV